MSHDLVHPAIVTHILTEALDNVATTRHVISSGVNGEVLYYDGTKISAGNIRNMVTIAATNATEAEKNMARMSGGSVCDGTSDESEIQTALNSGYSVQLSSGSFTISTAIAFKYDGQMIVGQGRRRTVIYTGAAIDMITFVGGAAGNYGANTVRGNKLADLTMCGHTSLMAYPQTKTANHGVMARYSVDWEMSNVEITGCKKWCLQLADIDGHSFRGYNLWLHDSGSGTTSEIYTGGLKIGSQWDEWGAGVSATYPHCKIVGLLVENCYDGVWICQTAFSHVQGVIEGCEKYGCVIDYQGAGYAVSPLDLQLYCEANMQATTGDDIYITCAESNDYHIHIHDSQLGSAGCTYAISVQGATPSTVYLNVVNNIYGGKTNHISTAMAWT
jgi:hypothetical protein